jgi:hypothetical protein
MKGPNREKMQRSIFVNAVNGTEVLWGEISSNIITDFFPKRGIRTSCSKDVESDQINLLWIIEIYGSVMTSC